MVNLATRSRRPQRRLSQATPSATQAPLPLDPWPFISSAERLASIEAAAAELRAEGELTAKAKVDGVQLASAIHAASRAPWSFITSPEYRASAHKRGAEDAAFLLRTLEHLLVGADDAYESVASSWSAGSAQLQRLEDAGALGPELAARLRATRARYADQKLVPHLLVSSISFEVLGLDSAEHWAQTTAHVLVHTQERFAAVPLRVQPPAGQPEGEGAGEGAGSPDADADGDAEGDADAHSRAAAAAAAAPAVERVALLTFEGKWHSFQAYIAWVRSQMQLARNEAGDPEPDELAEHPVAWELRDLNLLTQPAESTESQ